MTRVTPPGAPFEAWWSPTDELAVVSPHPDDARLAVRRFVPSARPAFLARRALARQALARFCPGESASIERSTASGVPAVLDGRLPVFLSMASAPGAAVCALSRSAPVGIDLEADEPLDDLAFLLERCHRLERNAILALPASSRQQAFLSLWTAKESVVKATGLLLEAVLQDHALILEQESGRPCWRSGSSQAHAIFPLAITGYVASACVAIR